MRTTLSVAAGAALAACALDSAAAFHVSGKAPLALATGRAGSARAVKPAGPMMKALTLNGKKLSKFEAMRFKAGRYGGAAGSAWASTRQCAWTTPGARACTFVKWCVTA